MNKNIVIEFIDSETQVSKVFKDWDSAEKHRYELSALGREIQSLNGNIRIVHTRKPKL